MPAAVPLSQATSPPGGDVHHPEWLRKLGEPGGICWTVRSLDTGEQWGPYYEALSQADIEDLDAGRYHRYEVCQWRDSPTGKARLRDGRPRLVRVRAPASSPLPPPPPGDTTGQLAYSVAQTLGRLEAVLAGVTHREQRVPPPNPWTTPTGEAAVPASTLQTIQAEADRRIRSAEEAATQRIASAERQARTEIDATKALHETVLSGMRRTIEDLEVRLRRAEGETDRLRTSLERLGDERDDLDRALSRAEDDARTIQYELTEARRRLENQPATLGASPSAPNNVGLTIGGVNIDDFLKFKSKIGEAAAAFGYVPAEVDNETREPLEVRKLKGYTDIASAGKDLLIDLVGAFRDRPSAPAAGAPAAPPRPQRLPAPPGRPVGNAGAPDGQKQLVAMLEAAFGGGESPAATVRRVAPLVPDEILGIFQAMPAPVFVQNVWTAAGEASPLRTMQARAWLGQLHAVIAGGPQAAEEPRFQPMPESPPSSQRPIAAAAVPLRADQSPESVPSPAPGRRSWIDGAERLTGPKDADAGQAQAASA